jgi:hypothetical protein
MVVVTKETHHQSNMSLQHDVDSALQALDDVLGKGEDVLVLGIGFVGFISFIDFQALSDLCSMDLYHILSSIDFENNSPAS